MSDYHNLIPGYYESLPRKRMAAGVLFSDEAGRWLMVETTYRKFWLLPGGHVELNEAPLRGAIREVKEELGLEISDVKLLCVDYMPNMEEKGEMLQFTFDGGTLTKKQIDSIVIQEVEIKGLHFLEPAAALEKMPSAMRARMSHFIEPEARQTLYLEGGSIPNRKLKEQ
jgi:8-oxo-dGTP diphosphatase